MQQHKEEITVERLYELYIAMKKEKEALREDIDILTAKVAALYNQVNSE